jgi:hypothetical protein
MRSVILLALLAAALASAAPVPAQPRPGARDAAVPFKVGERLTYDVTWSSFVVAGSAVSTVVARPPASDSTAYHIVAEGRPVPLLERLYNLYYKMETMLDTATLLPHRVSLFSEQSGARRLAATRFDRAQRKAFFDLDDAGTPLKSEFDIPPQVQDGLSTLYVLRAMTFKAGGRITLPVADDGSMYTVHADPAAPEQVRVPFGSMEAWRINVSIVDAEGQPAARDAAVWFSTDARRLPLKLQAELPVGHFVLVLRDAR